MDLIVWNHHTNAPSHRPDSSGTPVCSFLFFLCNVRVVSGLIIYCDRKWSGEMFRYSIRCPKETPTALEGRRRKAKGSSFAFQRCFCRFFSCPPLSFLLNPNHRNWPLAERSSFVRPARQSVSQSVGRSVLFPFGDTMRGI